MLEFLLSKFDVWVKTQLFDPITRKPRNQNAILIARLWGKAFSPSRTVSSDAWTAINDAARDGALRSSALERAAGGDVQVSNNIRRSLYELLRDRVGVDGIPQDVFAKIGHSLLARDNTCAAREAPFWLAEREQRHGQGQTTTESITNDVLESVAPMFFI